ncbi:hypothetical protein PAECIP111893_05054 [Paenibacillus plantiphilus]|uniref:MmcQ/YjbR family DNA-binding protein n=1 Tax=Paenibacillus plantiphilus TaxID=2905650 RepID=A0ABM9CVI0_9BACL|nr:hypothetical protein PAECIP111893_05054 [Paenibacillus plantiphilus]
MFLAQSLNPWFVLVSGAILFGLLFILERRWRIEKRAVLYWVQQSRLQLQYGAEEEIVRGEKEVQSLTEFCLAKRGAVKTFPFGPEPLVVKVGERMFALITVGSISLKCDPVIAENLREQYKAVTPGYHMNKQHWNTIQLDGSIPEEELHDMINHSYDLVFKGLTKDEKKRIAVSKSSS